MKEGEMEVTVKIRGYFITQIDVENYRGKQTHFKGKPIGRQRYEIPIAIKDKRCHMGMNVANPMIQF